MDERGQILAQFKDVMVVDMKAVSRRFAETIVGESNDVKIEIKASPFISTLVDGRLPTSITAPKGDPTLQQILLKWITDNGITPNDSKTTDEQLSWAMATSMHKHGDRLYQQGGGRDVFAEVLNAERINSIATLIADGDQKIIAETSLRNITL